MFEKMWYKRLGGPRVSYWVRGAGLALLLLGSAQVLLASGMEEEGEEGDLKLVASTSFIGELCEALAGDDAHIRVLMPRGINPHSYQPSPGDLAAIEDADRVFINGLGLEHQLIEAIEESGDLNHKMYDHMIWAPISKDVDILTTDDDEHGGLNAHLWLSPRSMMAGIGTVRESLSDANPGKAKVYRVRERKYLRRLRLLNAQVREATMSLDKENRRLVTGHPFMDYYARDYGFEIVGHIIDSVSDQAEPSAREIAELVELLRKENIGTIFISNSAGKAMKSLAKAVAAESGRDIQIVELLVGSLAPEGSRGSDYFDFIAYNTELIVEALGGN